METIKVWILTSDLTAIQENRRPTQFWLTNPPSTNVSELTISLQKLKEWQTKGNRQVLND